MILVYIILYDSNNFGFFYLFQVNFDYDCSDCITEYKHQIKLYYEFFN